MNAGSFSTPIVIETRFSGVDEIGQPIPENWVEHARVWADIRHLRGVEAIKAGAPVSAVSASIRIRWMTGLDAGMRVLAGPVVYEIKAVLPDMARREYVDLVAERTS